MSLSVTLALMSLAAAPTAATAPIVADSACPVLKPDKVPVKGRQSPLDSLTFTAGRPDGEALLWPPSARGRKMIGGENIPYGKLWRTGANEPTVIFTPVALDIAGVKVAPGKYSIYSVPSEKEWEIIVNRSTSQWGHESTYTKEVQAQEVGRGKAQVQKLDQAGGDLHDRTAPRTGRGAASLSRLGDDPGRGAGQGR